MLGARPVAYFSAEFGLHESMPIYSGGLGILAGDHMKSASDLGIPLVGVGLYYDQGYFRQRLDRDGWQHEEYINVDHRLLPIEPATHDGVPVTVEIETRTGRIVARVWRIAVGRNTLLLLDSNVDGNSPEDRELTARLYGGDQRVRIRQELLLGVGGVRALRGARDLARRRAPQRGAQRVCRARAGAAADGGRGHRRRARPCGRVSSQVVFTTHTPVPAGHDRFSPDLVEEHLGPVRDALGLSPTTFLALGRVDPHNDGEDFCMTVLALKMSHRANAVSSLHGHVSRAMWKPLYPGVARGARADRPHHQRRARQHLARAADAPGLRPAPRRRLGGTRQRHAVGGDRRHRRWRAVGGASDAQDAADPRGRGAARCTQAERRGEPAEVVAQLRRALSPDALTIGFARRFATYKRANLLLQDLEVLGDLVNDPQMPVQLIFAGKAHPLDGPGKAVLQQVAGLTRDPRFLGKIVFVEDYDIDVGRHLVQGVDVWLNNPRRPLEACGTSGQKVVLNGGLNLSVLDGWWAEAYDGLNGFAIGARRDALVNRRARRPRCARAAARAAQAGRAALLRPRPRRPAARVDRADEARHPHARLAVQRRPDGAWTTC